jgi:hypothetical protein
MATKKILTDGLTNKQRILRMVERWDDDIPIEQALYHMYALKKVMDGIKSAEEEELIDHDELFDELERLCDEEEAQAEMVPTGEGRLETSSKVDRRERRTKNGKIVRKPAKNVRK